jgi:hypothetical protein
VTAPLQAAAVEALQAIAQHRLLSTTQLQAIRGPATSRRWTQHLLADLEHRRLAAHVHAAEGPLKLWFATEHGARLARESGALLDPPRVLTADEASGPLQAHTLAVNEAGIAFLAAARKRGDDFGALSWRHEIPHPLRAGRRRHQLISDALITYLLAGTDGLSLEYRLLELDRATLSVDRLAAKLARYAELHRTTGDDGEPGWRRWYPTFPVVLVALAGDERAALERRRRTTLALCRSDPQLNRTPDVAISLCLLEDLQAQGPFAAILLDPTDPDQPVDWLGQPAEATSGRDTPRR